MENIRFFSVKISEQLDLDIIADVLNVTRTIKWNETLMVDRGLLEMILKRPVDRHEVYIYSFGVVTFVGFTEFDIRAFIEFINAIQPVDYDFFAKFYDHYEVAIGPYGTWQITEELLLPFKPMVRHISEIVAKSAGLSHMEAQLIRVMDSVEPMLDKLSKGSARNTKTTMGIISEIIVFKYKLTQNLKLFERPTDTTFVNTTRDGYDWLSNHFELEERYRINETKIEALKDMVYKYYHFNQERKVKSLYIFEVFLLALFPLMRMVGDYTEVVRLLLRHLFF